MSKSMPHSYHAMIIDMEDNTIDSKTITLKLPSAVEFKSGQHITLGKKIKGRKIYRTYSICLPSLKKKTDRIQLGIRLLPDGVFSSWLRQCQGGEALKVFPPTGKFYLQVPQSQNQLNLFIAGGSGITPILSMLEDWLKSYAKTQAILVYSNQTLRRTMFLEKLLQLKNQFIDRLELYFFTSRESQEVTWRNTRIDNKTLEELMDNNIIPLKNIGDIYLCGPNSMMEVCRDFFLRRRFSKKSIFSEPFTSSKDEKKVTTVRTIPKDKSKKSIAKVKATLRGLEQIYDFVENDESLLSSAIRNGIKLPHACTVGMCGTCRAKLIKGKVKMEKNYALDDEELSKNFILTCQGKPTTAEVTISFDF